MTAAERDALQALADEWRQTPEDFVSYRHVSDRLEHVLWELERSTVVAARQAPRVTYAKLPNGSWGVRVPRQDGVGPGVGEIVEVTRRDGTTQTETIAAIVRTEATYVVAAVAAKDGTAYQRTRGRQA